MEPRALRCCEQKSVLCCSCHSRRGTWRCRALSTVGLEVTRVMAMAMNHVFTKGTVSPKKWVREESEGNALLPGWAGCVNPSYLPPECRSCTCVFHTSSSTFALEDSPSAFSFLYLSIYHSSYSWSMINDMLYIWVIISWILPNLCGV